MRVFGLAKVNEQQRAKVALALNDLNCDYRYVKFCIDSDGDVNAEYDFTDRGTDPAASANEILVHFVRILDKAYPTIMRTLWS